MAVKSFAIKYLLLLLALPTAAYAHLGKKEAALDYLEKALEKGYEDFQEMEKDARWEGLRADKKYKELMGRYVPEEGKD
jgi:hypothetical protein